MVTKAAVERAREGRGPSLIEAVTYRLSPERGAFSRDDPGKYRSLDEVKQFEKYDPIVRLRKYLIDRGYISEKEDREIYEYWDRRMEDIVKKCLSKPQLPEEVIFDDVYSKRFWDS